MDSENILICCDEQIFTYHAVTECIYRPTVYRYPLFPTDTNHTLQQSPAAISLY